MSTPMLELDDIIERVHAVIKEAEAAGEQPPGRPTLMRLTGLSEYQVRRAQEVLSKGLEDDESPAVASEPPAVSSGSPAESDNVPDTDEMPVFAEPVPMPVEAAGDGLEVLEIQPGPAGDPVLQPVSSGRQPRPWPLLIIGLAAAVAVWSGWVGLGRLCGFGMITPLPGIVDKFQLNTSIVLPLSVEAYGAYALRCWLGSATLSPRTVRFAKISSVSSLAIGAGAQVAYHLMAAANMAAAPWQITMLVACVPVAVLGLASALAKLVTADRQRISSSTSEEVQS
ncbi:hypothetical protein ORV05_05415 [Amycolatopsis cynarae]|uniref:ABC transporter permease n=1 Tax=Amycolatopsis cynarae TaxID=2995223 RepID=A0ABY7B7R1_9PSEU|nr:hypothetical protein [Amycolatopsis sp. HUAS 11-8]WAL67228.1 hypothetical protein ORV05_05415 [Amycolatopsis sp. HUAS 11-8]